MTIHPKREYTPEEIILQVLTVLDIASGDSDPNIDPDMTDDEVRSEYPVVWAMQQLTSLASQLAAQKREGESALPNDGRMLTLCCCGKSWDSTAKPDCACVNQPPSPDQDREVSP
jgi:hypothetical protein